MTMTRRQLLILLPAAAIAWESILAGTPEAAPNYNMTEHWWGMLIDVTKCIGCGTCVQACQAENNVPDGYFRTWVERYHVPGWPVENPVVDSPDGGKHGFPAATAEGGKNFFVPKMCNHCADSPCTQVCPVGATFRLAGRRGAGRPDVLPGMPLLHSGLPLRLPLPESRNQDCIEVHALLSPHHQGTHHRVLRDLSQRRLASLWILRTPTIRCTNLSRRTACKF